MRHLVLGGTPLYTAATTADPATNSTLALDFGNAAVQATGATLQPQLTENFGFEAWAKSTTTTGRHWLLYNGNLGGDGWGLFQDGASYFVYCADRVQFGGGSVTPDQWTHLAVVRVNGLTTLYVNGDAVASSTIAPNLPGGSFAAGAHQGNPGGGERWVGAIDEIRYFTFPPGQFVPRDLLLRKAEIQITQAEGPEIFDGGTRDFGALPVGSSATAGFTIHSTGNLDLTGFQASLEGPDAAEFALTAPETLAMAPGASRSFTVRFDAASGGTKSAVLRLTTNDPDENPFDIHLSAVATDPEIEVQQPVSVPVPDGGSRQFEKLLLGNQQTLSFAIRNTGNVPLNLTGTPRVAITGPHAADFTVAAQPLPTAFPGGGGQTHFQSGFETPALTHLGNFTYNIAGSGWAIEGKAGVARNISPWFVNNAPEGSQAAFIQADGSTAGTISRSVNFPEAGLYTVRFQAVRRGATNPAVDIVVAVGGAAIGTVANGSQPDNSWRTFEIPYLCTAAGDHELRFTASRSGGDYASAIDAVEVVSSPVFDVTFAPSAHGPRTATLVIASNDRDEGSYEIELSGRGQGVVAELAIDQPTGSPALSGGSRDFGSVDVGSFSSLDFTLRNTGLVDLLLSGTPPVVIDGPDAGDFSVTVQPPAILPVSTALAEGFESPALGGGGFSYAPGGSAWTYGSSTGRARNGSPWFVMPAPEGEHAAFIQRQPGGSAAAATISRSYNFPAAGDYLVSFSLTRRSDLFPAVDLAVKMDGSTLGSVAHGSQADDDWHRFSVAYHCSNPGDHVLTFTGSRAEAGDYASAIDRIQIEMATVFTVKFAPAAGGPRSAALSIPSNDPFSPYTLQLTGSGVQVYTALESWRLLHFATAANAGNAADDADPNHNGIPNLIEYALGGDPAGNATGIAILPQMELDAEGHAKIRFTRYPGRVGITLAAQGSSDLSGAWADLAVSVDGAAFGNLAAGVLIDESGTGESRETTLTDGGHAGGMRFLRLKVTSP
ncbi:choice-of-anchor D domain-containing protein [Luteolibacter sp. Populi]|uniref:choice-of-anchor D domain-containing protein n=1 Tax=Luteolibacter sp. Populi TaxID=3230487 RepID=UPI0034668528